MVTRQNPYVGPRTFTREDAKLFFGREREARDLLDRVISERLVLFYAQSGAGKSSLVNTRLIPHLQQEGFNVLPVGRISGDLPTGMGATANIFLFNLMLSLDQSPGDPARFASLSLREFLAHLTSDDGQSWYYDPHAVASEAVPVSAASAAQLLAAAGPPPTSLMALADDEPAAASTPYVLIIDQFEEIITSHPAQWNERADFFRQLNEAMLADRSLWVVLTLREDYVAALDPYAPIMEDRLRARYYMQRMGAQAALEAIQEPAAAYGRAFAPGAAEMLVDNLRRVQIVGGVAKAPTPAAARNGDEPVAQPVAPAAPGAQILGETIEPVQLQVVCYQLWERLANREQAAGATPAMSPDITVADVLAYGDVDSALTNFYEETLAAVLVAAHKTPGAPISERRLRDWFSQQLITEAETRGLVYQSETQTGGLPNAVVEEFEQRFLVRAEVRGGGAWIELVHDRFVAPILAANRAWLLHNMSPLTQAAEAWRSGGKNIALLLNAAQLPEAQTLLETDPTAYGELERTFVEASRTEADRQRARQQRLLWGAAGLAVLVLAALTSWALWSAYTAQQETMRANFQTVRANEQAARANEQAARAEAETGRANSETRRANEQQQRAEALAEEAARARAGQLAVQAQAALSNYNYAESLLLAVEAITTTWALRAAPAVAHLMEVDRVLQQTLLATGGSPQLVQGGQVFDVAFSPDGQWIATGGTDGKVRLWPVQTPITNPIVLDGHTGTVYDVVFSPDGHYLASASADYLVGLWSMAAPTAPPRLLQGHTAGVARVAFSPDGQWLASASSDNSVRLWPVAKPDGEPRVLRGHTAPVRGLDFSADGKLLASTSHDKTVRIWRLEDPAAPPVVLEHDDRVETVAFSPDDKTLATGGWDKALHLWTVADAPGKPVLLSGHTGTIWDVTFSPDRRWLASAGDDGRVLIWSLADPTKEPIRLDQAGSVYDVTFSPDSAWLASDGKDKAVFLLDMANPRTDPIVLRSHTDTIFNTEFSPDGSQLVSASFDGSVRLYTLDLGRLAALACAQAKRNFNDEEWQRYFGSEPYRKTCGGWPVHSSVVEAVKAKARALAADNKQTEAIAQFERVLTLDPTATLDPAAAAQQIYRETQASARIATAQSLAAQLEITRAIALYEEAVRLNPELVIDPRAESGRIAAQQLIVEAKKLAQKADVAGAVALYTEAISLDNTLTITPAVEAQRIAAATLTAAGRLLARRGEVPEAVAKFTQAQGIDPTLQLDPQLSAQIEYGRGLVASYRPLDGMAALEAARTLSPTYDITATLSAAQWDSVCRAGSLADRASTVLPACERALIQEPAATAYRANRAIARALTDDLPGAVADLEAYTAWAEESYGQEESMIVGRKGWIAALKRGLNPVRASVLTLSGRFDAAAPSYAAIRALDPPVLLSPDELNNICWYGALAGAAQEVLYACDWALMLRPNETNYLDSRGLARAAMGDLHGAVRDFEGFLSRSQTPIDSAVEGRRRAWIVALKAGYNPVLAYIQARNGQIDAALALYSALDAAEPPLQLTAEQWNNLCWQGSLHGRAAAVLFACERAVTLAPNDANYRDSRGLAHLLTGDYAGASADIAFTIEQADQVAMARSSLAKRRLALFALGLLEGYQGWRTR